MEESLKVLWVTSFAEDMYEPSAKHLISSFLQQNTFGDMLACVEMDPIRVVKDAKVQDSRLIAVDLSKRGFLKNWLDKNKAYIPTHLGGEHPGCQCPGGPYEPQSKQHKMPCVGAWFCRNASRWFRKMASIAEALLLNQRDDVRPKYNTLIWVDADCLFRRSITEKHLWEVFEDGKVDLAYMKNKRPVIEGSIVGYRINKPEVMDLIDWMGKTYVDGTYRGLQRWDDCYMLQKALEKHPHVRRADVAHSVGEHAAVVEHSAWARFLTHDKGRHSRGVSKGVMI